MRKKPLVSEFVSAKNGLLPVDITVASHVRLLKQAYDGVYTQAFPIEEERVPFNLWLTLADPKSSAPIKLSIILSSHNFSALEPDINGISVGMYYTKSQTAIIGYNAVSAQDQGKGLGTAMQQALIKNFQTMADGRGESLRGIFVEINDPAVVDAAIDSFDPSKRMEIYKKWGAFDVPIKYIQPALSLDQDKFHGAKLLYYPTHGNVHPSIATVRDFLFDMYTNYGYENPASDSDFQTMMTALDTYQSEHLGSKISDMPSLAEKLSFD